MVKKIKRLVIWVAIILALLVGWKAYDEYQFVQETDRAMDLLGEPEKPDVVIDQDGTIRGKGYAIKP
jgi:hypothetical protein